MKLALRWKCAARSLASPVSRRTIRNFIVLLRSPVGRFSTAVLWNHAVPRVNSQRTLALQYGHSSLSVPGVTILDNATFHLSTSCLEARSPHPSGPNHYFKLWLQMSATTTLLSS